MEKLRKLRLSCLGIGAAGAMALCGIASAQEGPFEPWVGEMGVTETVAEIMARGSFDPAWKPGDPLRFNDEKEWERDNLPSDPASPLVPCWPYDPKVGPLINVAKKLGGRDTPPNLPQGLGTEFLGPALNSSGFIPPDTEGSVSPTQILIPVNGRIRVYSKAGVLGSLNVTMDSFFTSVRNGSQISDPQVEYDWITGRWFVQAITTNTPNRVVLAVSSGSTITNTSSFTFFFFQQDLVAPTGNTGGFADYGKMGVDANAVLVGANMFNSSLTSFVGTTGWVIQKASVLGAGPIVATAFRNLATSTGAGPYSPSGVTNRDPAATESYFVGVDNATTGRIVIRRVSTPGGSPTISANLNITVPATTGSVIDAPASGSSPALDTLDDRLFANVMQKNRKTGNYTLWTAHNITVNTSGVASTSGGRVGTRWYELQNLTTTPSLKQSGTLFDPAASNPVCYSIPSIAMSGQGHAAMGVTSSSAATFAGASVAGRLHSDASGTTQAATLVEAGGGTYNLNDGSRTRWGDYSAVAVDPSDDQSMWAFMDYVNSTDSWAIRCVKLLAPLPVTPNSASPNTLNQGASNVNITFSGPSVSGSEFYDTEAGFNRLQAAFSGTGVTVNSVSFNHATPTQVTLNVSVTGGATLGARNVTFTNPDGQTSVATGLVTIQSGSVCPSFTTNPVSATVCENGSVTFTVAATGTPAPTFQWRKNSVDIGGATGTSLNINPVTSGDAGTYDCVATNSCGSTPSAAATLNVNTAPSITLQPAGGQGIDGQSFTFIVNATGTPAPTFQWRKDTVDIGGATSSSYTINILDLTDAGTYDCVVTNSCGSATTNGALLEVFCAADVNLDGFIDAIDYDLFITAWLASDLFADYNGDEFVDAIDYDAFINDWLAAGC